MRSVRLALATSLGVLLIGGSAIPREQEPTYPEPGITTIDWQRQVIITNSLGSPNTDLPQTTWRGAAVRAARVSAYRDLLEVLKGVAVNSATTVENMMVTSDVIRTKVEGFVRDFRLLDVKYYEAMDVGMVAEIPLTGGLTEILLEGEQFGSERSVVPAPGQARRVTGGPVVTGLIVDATGFDVTPAMAPKILDEEGNEVYGTAEVTRNYAVTQGVVGYHNDVTAASQNERVAGNPLIVRATGAAGPNICDVVISMQSANLIREAAKNQPFLSECRVMIVLGG